MFCPNCSHLPGGGDAYCVACGSRLRAMVEREGGDSTAMAMGAVSPAVSWRGGQVAMGIVLVGLSFLLVSGVTLLLEPLPHGLAWGAWAGSHLIGLAILAAVWLLGSDRGRLSAAALGLTRPRISWGYSALLALLALGLGIGATALYDWLLRPLAPALLLPPEIPRELAFPGAAALLTFEALAVWTPLTEEIFFRGFVFVGLIPRWGVWRATAASALIFSLFHLHPGVLVPIFIIGLLLAWLYRFTGSLWPPIMAHAGQNAIALAALFYQSQLPG